MTDGLYKQTELGFRMALLLALHGADATQTDCRDMDLPLRKEGQMTALRCLALLILIVSLPYIALIGGWIADQATAYKKLPTKGIDDET